MKEKAAQGVGVVVNYAKFITEEQELFCEKMVFEVTRTGDSLLYFGLRFWHSVCFEGRAGAPNLGFKHFQLC